MKALANDEFLSSVAATLSKIGDRKTRCTASNGRMRYCSRCDRNAAEYEKHDPTWTPPMAHSWAARGQRYWSDLCRSCIDIDTKQRKAASESAARAAEVQEKRPQTGMRGRVYQPPQKATWER